MEPGHYRLEDLASPKELASYTFLSTPRRDPSTVGASRSVCLNLNTNAAPVMMNNFDDFWGNGSRRVQIYVNSISTPYCQVLNVKPAWRGQCVVTHGHNATLCHQYVLDHFDELRANRSVRMAVIKDVGMPGAPFLRCLARPLEPFQFQADLLAYNAYWAGSEYHVTIQTSDCRGVPLVKSTRQDYTLFQTVNVDEACDILVLLPPAGWVAFLIPWIYSAVTLALVAQGLVLALFHTKTATYLPHDLRIGKHRRWLRFALPFMEIINKVSGHERSIITFKGSLLVASDVWMTHWLYMWLSILDAVVNIRATYVPLQIAEALLQLKTTSVGLLYLCGALVKTAWLMCLVQTVLRLVLKLAARCLRSLRLIKSTTREKLEWDIGGASILLSYRLYYVILFITTFTLVETKGDPSFMVHDTPYKVGAHGGPTKIASFWGSEVACDLVTLLGLLSLTSMCVGLAMLQTKYRRVAGNKTLRFLQKRYMVSGWDGLLAADLLGLHPNDHDAFVDGKVYTKTSVGSLLQLLFLSGPSGFVHLAGYYIFHDNGFSRDPVRFSYPIPQALAMGLFSTGKGSVVSSSSPGTTNASKPGGDSSPSAGPALNRTREEMASALVAKRSIFERQLRLVSDGYLGKVLLIDAHVPGQVVTNKEAGQREYEVVDALTTMSILDIKHLMGNDKKIRLE